MPRRPVVPPTLREGPFRWADVRGEVPEHLLRTQAVRRVARGAYVPQALVDDLATRLAAVALVLVDDAGFSHTTAAVLLGAPLPPHRDDRIHVTVPSHWQAPGRQNMVGHHAELPLDHVTTCHGVRITSPARTFVDLASVLGLADLVAVGDFLVGRQLSSLSELDRTLQWATGRRGVRRARLARDLINGRARSPQESVVRVWLAQAGLPVPQVNGWITDPLGIARYQGDLVFRAERVIVEYDGEYHRDRAQFAADLRRRNDLQRWGWRVVHVEASMLARPLEVVHLVRDALRAVAP